MTHSRLFIFFTSLFLAASLISTKTIFAEGTTNEFLQEQEAINATNGLGSWSKSAMTSNAVTIFNSFTGDIPEEALTVGSSSTGFIPGGAFGTLNKMIASLNSPPASGIEYIAQVKDSFLGKPAYAQGVGFNGLQFLLPLWRGFRNAVYVLASIIFVAIGIMIMLRVKISPQAVVTVQSAIPQLVTTLILVTFSYAIAGLVIDLCNFIQALVVALLFSVKGVPLTDSLFPGWWGGTGLPLLSDVGNFIATLLGLGKDFSFANLSNPNLHQLQMLTYRASPGWFSMVMLGGLLGSIVMGFLLGGVGNMILGAAGSTGLDMFGRVLGGAAGVLGGLLVPIILCIIVCIWLIKLYFGLLKNYVTVIFKIILGPLEIGMGAFPNAKMGFSSWIMDVVANMAVFPVVGIFLILLNMVVDAIAGTNVGSSSLVSTVWAPSLISFNGISPTIISAAVGLAGLALLSKLPEMVPQYIFMIKPSPWGQAIGQGLDFAKSPEAKMAGHIVGETYAAGVDKKVKTAENEGEEPKGALKVNQILVNAGRGAGFLERRR